MAGPRQSGKTTLTKIISRDYLNKLYFNWDIAEDRLNLLKNPVFFESVERKDNTTPIIIFDEIHKYKEWKNYLKGIYDQFHNEYNFLITGSGRLNIYQKGGDSLAGRYFLFHLFPFTIAELGGNNIKIDDFLRDPLRVNTENSIALKKIWLQLNRLSGFPEPYLSKDKTLYRRWSNTYSNQLIREDIRDLSGIKAISDIESLYYLLPSKVGSSISIPSLSGNLKVSYDTIKNWLSIFEKFFLTFSVYPWSKKISRAIQKDRKIYLFDAPRIQDQAARFENMVALELYRAIVTWNNIGYGSFSLHFIKNKEQQEIDFLICNNNKPFVMIETKQSDKKPSIVLKKYQDTLNIPAVQLVNNSSTHQILSNKTQSILIAPAYQWLSQLPF